MWTMTMWFMKILWVFTSCQKQMLQQSWLVIYMYTDSSSPGQTLKLFSMRSLLCTSTPWLCIISLRPSHLVTHQNIGICAEVCCSVTLKHKDLDYESMLAILNFPSLSQRHKFCKLVTMYTKLSTVTFIFLPIFLLYKFSLSLSLPLSLSLSLSLPPLGDGFKEHSLDKLKKEEAGGRVEWSFFSFSFSCQKTGSWGCLTLSGCVTNGLSW